MGQSNLKENVLTESEELHRFLTEQAADGIFILDLKGKIIYANKAALKMIKVNRRQLLGRHFARFVEKDYLDKTREFLKKVQKGTPVIRDELEILDKQGHVISVDFTASAIYKKRGIFRVHIIIRDISERKKIESLMREKEKMTALQHFIMGTTREIQYPLKGLLESTRELIEKYKYRSFEYIGYKEFKELMGRLEAMCGQLRCCCETVTHLAGLQKKKSGIKDRFCDVGSVIREAIEMVAHLIKKTKIKLNLRIQEKLPPAAMATMELNQVVLNIFTNAIHSIPERGDISLRVNFLKGENRILIECRDSGVGIPKENLPHIFEPFFTTKHKSLERSAGLGLSIVYSILKAHQGDIVVASHLRKGTTVKIFIPAYSSKSENG